MITHFLFLFDAVAPIMARNDPVYPFAFRVGHKGKILFS